MAARAKHDSAVQHPHGSVPIECRAAAQQHAALCTAALYSSIISIGIVVVVSTSTGLVCESGAHQQAGEPHTRREAI